jgi:hypothetical protein
MIGHGGGLDVKRFRGRMIGAVSLAAALGALMATTAAGAPSAAQVPCSVGGPSGLIAAINAAKQAGGGTLDLAAGCTYKLTVADNDTDGGNGLPVLTGRITIVGGRGTTIARGAASDIPEFRILEVAKHATVSITGVTLTGGKLTDEAAQGGGIASQGTITALTDDRIHGNSAPLGGGVYNIGRIHELSRDVITGNHAGNGGGVANLGRIDRFAADEVSQNAAGIGGGITNGGAIADLSGSTISDNHLTNNGAGGGIANSFGALNMSDDVVSGNTATAGPQASGGGIDNSGRLTLRRTVIKNNVAEGVGGGIRNEEQADKQFVFTIKSVIVTGNTVTSSKGPATGGGIYNAGEMTINVGVVADNHARTESGRAVGAGIYNGDTLTLTKVAIGENVAHDPGGVAEGGALYVDKGSKETTLHRSAIRGNAAVGAEAHGGGILWAGGKKVQLLETVVLKNRPDDCYPHGKVRGCVS